jgi:hypothetical protein
MLQALAAPLAEYQKQSKANSRLRLRA